MFGMVASHILFSLLFFLQTIFSIIKVMEFKRFKRKGLIFNNNSIGLGLELRIGKKIKVFRIERLTKEDKTFEFLEKRDADCSFFDGEPKVWKKIKG